MRLFIDKHAERSLSNHEKSGRIIAFLSKLRSSDREIADDRILSCKTLKIRFDDLCDHTIQLRNRRMWNEPRTHCDDRLVRTVPSFVLRCPRVWWLSAISLFDDNWLEIERQILFLFGPSPFLGLRLLRHSGTQQAYSLPSQGSYGATTRTTLSCRSQG